jgi:hypothetical protein
VVEEVKERLSVSKSATQKIDKAPQEAKRHGIKKKQHISLNS